jgi:DNA-binding transcriptional regulator GbsR (MarR family)
METKLTLKMDKAVILSAKDYAEQNHRSLSRLVENYFKNLTQKYATKKKYSPLVESLIGTISEDDLNKLVEKDDRARWIVKREL